MIRRRGFTLIEMLVVVAILSILAGAAFPLADLVARREREHELRLALAQLRTGLDAYKQAYDDGRILKRTGASGFPRDLDELVAGVDDASSPTKKKIYFLRRLPRDPMFAGEPETPAAETWGLRSYASPPEDPQPGEDVFDVHSLSPKVGLDGIAYREW
ncbi:MAG TPA: type II secretion system protein [Rhodocyclaceae bacterium]|nr:type II secretion system protein [Rhodocyclaceae bacterium]